MTEAPIASLSTWLARPMGPQVAAAVDRLRRAPDVRHVAVMPDVHLAEDVCVGVVIATTHSIYPQAVGGDIGCGMLSVAVDGEAAMLRDPGTAGRVLADLGRSVPARRHNRRTAIEQPTDLRDRPLSHSRLNVLRETEGALEFATLGSGNHFIELQEDDDGKLWITVHCGSRILGQAIRDHHLARGRPAGNRLRILDAESESGAAYLHDAAVARHFADASRRAIAAQVAEVLANRLSVATRWDTLITTDHNHVSRERHFGADFWIHRKGAMRTQLGECGVLPGSMGTLSFHVTGRGHEAALCSSAHGAGRALSRTEARMRVTERDLARQMEGVWYDSRLAERLRDEAPSAYKDIRAVLRAQREMVKVIRTLRPVLNYKGA